MNKQKNVKNAQPKEDSSINRYKNKKRTGYKGKRNRSGDESGEFRGNIQSTRLSSLNDISWYSRNPELLASAARFPFPYVPGMVLDVPEVQSKDTTLAFKESIPVPGVFCIDFIPTIGYSDDVNSPVSVAAKELFGRVRSKFSGSLDADAPDMMMFNLALDSVHSYIAYLKRLYRALGTYSPQNRDYPQLLVAAIVNNQGTPTANFDKLVKDKTKFWGVINELVHMVNKFSLPRDMDLYERHRWMCEHVYMDGATPKAQSYVFVPKGFWKVDDTGTTGTALKFMYLSDAATNAYSVDYYYQYGKDLIQALSDWEDAYTISGYYARAFEGENLYKADLLLQDEVLEPVFQPEVLTQIENAQCASFTVPDITQDPNTNAVLFQPTANNPTGMSNTAVVMNLHTDMPTGENVTIASRLITYVKDGKVMCGTEAVNTFRMYLSSTEDDIFRSNLVIDSLPTQVTTGVILNKLCRLSWFKSHPIIFVYNATASTPTAANTNWSILGDLENVACIPKDNMSALHRVCIYSEFNCFR